MSLQFAPALLSTLTLTLQQGPSQDLQEPVLFPINLDASFTLLDTDGLPATDLVYVELEQFYSTWAFRYCLWATPDGTGNVQLSFSQVELDPSMPVDILIAPVQNEGEARDPGSTFLTAHEGRNFESYASIQIAPQGGGHSISLGAVSLADAPSIGTVTLGAIGDPDIWSHAVAGTVSDGFHEVALASPHLLQAGQPCTLFSWNGSRNWTVCGHTADGGEVRAVNLLRGRSLSAPLEYPIQFTVNIDTSVHGQPHTITFFPTNSYSPLNLPSGLTESEYRMRSHLHASKGHRVWLEESSSRTVEGFFSGSYVAEIWSLADYRLGAPAAAPTVTPLEGGTVNL